MVLPIAVMTISSTSWSSLSVQAGPARRMVSIAALVDMVSPARNFESADETSSWAGKSTTGALETMSIGLLRHELSATRIIRRMVVFASEIVVRPDADRTPIGLGTASFLQGSARCCRPRFLSALRSWLDPYTHRSALGMIDLKGIGLAHEIAQLAKAEGSGIEVRCQIGELIADNAERHPAVLGSHL